MTARDELLEAAGFLETHGVLPEELGTPAVRAVVDPLLPGTKADIVVALQVAAERPVTADPTAPDVPLDDPDRVAGRALLDEALFGGHSNDSADALIARALKRERKLAAFDAAPVLAEASPLTVAVLALAEQWEADAKRHDDAEPISADGLTRMILAARFLRMNAADLRTTLAAVLAADPEPRGELS